MILESSRRDNNNEDNGVKEEKECKVESHQSNNETQIKSKRAEGRSYTVSIAVPASVLDIPQTHELKTCLVGQVVFIMFIVSDLKFMFIIWNIKCIRNIKYICWITYSSTHL